VTCPASNAGWGASAYTAADTHTLLHTSTAQHTADLIADLLPYTEKEQWPGSVDHTNPGGKKNTAK
jgi:hypothetical protein